MEKFKAGEKVKCVSSKVANLFESGKKYEVESVLSDGLNVYDRSRDIQLVRYGSTLASFEPLTTKFTTVSGDQSLFELLKAGDDDLYIIRNVGLTSTQCAIYPSNTLPSSQHTHLEVIAERKHYVKQWIPEVGELFIWREAVWRSLDVSSCICCINIISGELNVASVEDIREVEY